MLNFSEEFSIKILESAKTNLDYFITEKLRCPYEKQHFYRLSFCQHDGGEGVWLVRMNIFIARQPIFDRHNKIFGYELLFRQNSNNYFVEMDDDAATAGLIYNAFLIFGIDDLTDGKKAFINVSKTLMDSDFLKVLPKDKVILEVLERDTATEKTINACQQYVDLGYQLALDDFVFDANNMPLLNLATIVKIEFQALSWAQQAAFIKKYRSKFTFLAEKIETQEEFHIAKTLGYDLFQGYFFSKPAMFRSNDIKTVSASLLNILGELNTPEPSFTKIAEIIQTDLGLSYKLLRLANSVYFGAAYKVQSITHALTYLGTRELYQWISLMLLKDMQDDENSALVKQSLIRAKLMQALAAELHGHDSSFKYFCTGLFSMIDIILCRDLCDILTGLPLPDSVKRTLLGEQNDMRDLLTCIESIEKAEWDTLEAFPIMRKIQTDRFMELYVDAIKWANTISV